MKHWSKYLIASLTMAALLFLAACNLPSSQGPTGQDDPALLYTAAAQTVSAQLQTQAPLNTEIVFVTATATLPALPTNTSAPTATLAPTNTVPPPTATQIPVPCDRASFVQDVSYPDNTEVAVGAAFTKTWRLKNNGTCTWNSSYAVVFVRGDSMGGPAATQLTTGSVAPGQTVDISVNLTAPGSTGTYQGFWQLRNGSGLLFGLGADAKSEFWVKIKTINPTPSPTPTPKVNVGFDFVDKGPSAEWRNTSVVISWGDPPEDDPGVAVNLDSVKLENNKTYSKVLATYPQNVTDGYVRGLYASYTVQTGDRFKAFLGLRADCGSAKVRYQLFYKEGATETLQGEWLKVCDGNVLTIDQDLVSLVGKTVQFILVVKAEGSPTGDRAIWANPRIERPAP